MSKKFYQVIRNGQIIGTRKSDRDYTHAVVKTALPENYTNDDSRWPNHMTQADREAAALKEAARLPVVVGYCGSLALAQKNPDASRLHKCGYKTEIVPVTVKA